MSAIWFLFACTWKAALLVGFGALLLQFWPRSSAAERHAAWAVILLALLVLPVLSLVWSALPLRLEDSSAHQVLAVADGYTVVRVLGGEEESAVLEAIEGGSGVVVGIWALGVLLGLMRSVLGYARARRYPQGAAVFKPDVSAWPQPHEGTFPFPVMLSPMARMPMVIGLVHPCIVLPANAPSWTPQQLRRVLLHEAAHLERKDPAWKLTASFVGAFYWFHPFVWLALRQLSSQREQACDDRVLAAGDRPSRYAGDLLEFARSALRVRNPEAVIPMASPKRLEARIAAILDATRPRHTLRRSNMTAYTCTLALLLVPLSALTSAVQPPPPPDALRADFHGSPAAPRELTAQRPAPLGLRTPAAPANLAPGTKADARLAEAPHSAIVPAAVATGPVAVPVIAAQEERPSRIRVGGGVQQAKLIKQVKPVYPADAKAEGVEGLVRLNVRIDKEGLVVETEVESSPDARLAQSAVEAVSQWIYAPTLLNGDPVEVLTVVDVNFTLQK